jgi:hypothetical protein
MFDLGSYGLHAKNARVLERIYHKGQAQIWDGEAVLDSLFADYGKPSLDPEVKRALGRVFSIVLWGELAAWKISAQLADELEPLEARMAATSQAFDEARHFYVMHDYLTAIDALPDKLDFGAQSLLESVMNTDHIAKKLLGMQLMVEPIALTIFHVVKRLEIEPVLTHLLPYYERDEARHVALGVQYLPVVMSKMSKRELLDVWLFQLKLITFEVWSNYGLARDLATLGLDAKELIRIGKGKQIRALDMLFENGAVPSRLPSEILGRYADTLVELTLPDPSGLAGLPQRITRAAQIAIRGSDAQAVELTPEISDADTPLVGQPRKAQRERPASVGDTGAQKRHAHGR